MTSRALFRQTLQGRYSSNYPTDLSYLVRPLDWNAATGKAIIACHHRGGDATFIAPTTTQPAPHATALARAGYAVLGVDHARINSWGDPDAMRALDDAYTYLRTTLGILGSTKVGLMGWSMGGLTGLNWTKRNPSLVACGYYFNPATDLRFWRDASGSYTPPYALGGVTQGVATAEINTTYAPTSAAVGGYTIPASGGAGITMTITTGTGKSFADGHNNAVIGKPQATINSVAFTYTSKTDNTLVGCVSTTGSTITVTNGMAITSSYATQSNGYRVFDETAFFAGLTVPVMIVQASDDTTVPPAMNANDANGFVGKVNTAYVSLRSPAPTGGHSGGLLNSPTSDTVSFFQSYLPTT